MRSVVPATLPVCNRYSKANGDRVPCMLPQSAEPQDSLARDTFSPRARLTLQPDMIYSIRLQLNQNKHGRLSFVLIIHPYYIYNVRGGRKSGVTGNEL